MFTMMYTEGIDNYFDPQHNSMFVSGSHKIEDLWDDIILPFNQLEKSTRYKTADTMYKQNEKNIKYVFGHSLSGVLVNHLNNNHKSLQRKRVQIYNSPLTALDTVHKNVKDKSNYLDVISMLDSHAKRQAPNINIFKNHFSYIVPPAA